MQNILRCAIFAAVAFGLSSPANAGDLKLTIQGGRVTLFATDVPLRQILQEWARVGQTTIVNAEKLTGGSVTIQLVDAPEKYALDVLLRSAAGYIAAPRPTAVANAAYYDRITILATSRPPAATAAAMAPPPPTFQRPPMPVDDDEPINVSTPPQQVPTPVTSQFPGMPPQNQNQPGVATQPGALTSPRPGALPQPAPNTVNPYQPIPRPQLPGGPGGPGGE